LVIIILIQKMQNTPTPSNNNYPPVVIFQYDQVGYTMEDSSIFNNYFAEYMTRRTQKIIIDSNTEINNKILDRPQKKE
jgi:hypothetical protein